MWLLLVFCVGLAAADTQCINRRGTCRDTSQGCSGGSFVRGLCNGPTNRQCCIRDDSRCTSIRGTCRYTTQDPCKGGTYRPGLCQGPTERQCCVPTEVEGGRSNQACSTNPTNRIRGQDCSGAGWWLAPRGTRKHRGIDVICSQGANILAPISGTLSLSAPYRNPTAKQRCVNKGVRIRESARRSVTLWYVEPNRSLVGRQVTRGQVVARHIGLHCAYSSCMTDHTHLALWNYGTTIDPTPEFGGSIDRRRRKRK